MILPLIWNYLYFCHENQKYNAMIKKKNLFGPFPALFILGALMLYFTACKQDPPATPLIHLGDIPEEYLATVPYQDGDVVKMMHENSGLVINYRVERSRFHNMDEPMGEDYDYQVDYTNLKPDRSTFEMGITLTAEYKKYELEGEEAPKTGLIMLKDSSTNVPFITTDATGYTVLDSLEVNGKVYYDVFKLDCRHYEFPPDYEIQAHSIYASSCYYNYAKGIIGVELSNGEKYLLFEE